MEASEAHRLLELHRDELLALPGVVGVGVGGTEADAVMQIFQSGELSEKTERRAQKLVGDAPMSFTGLSIPEANTEDK